MREHVNGLYGSHLVFTVQQLQVACLGCRVTAYVNDTFRFGSQNYINDIIVHTCPGRIGNDDIRTSVFADKVFCQDILHITGIEQGIRDSVDLRIHFCIFNGFGYIFDTDDLACTA